MKKKFKSKNGNDLTQKCVKNLSFNFQLFNWREFNTMFLTILTLGQII